MFTFNPITKNFNKWMRKVMCYSLKAMRRTSESVVDILISAPTSTKGQWDSGFLAPRETMSPGINGLLASNPIIDN